jgi:hypothetical protein
MIIQVNFIYFLKVNVRRFFVVILVLLYAQNIWAQYPVIQAKVDKQKITVGDFITYEYRLQYNRNYFAVGLEPIDSSFFAPFTIIKVQKPDTVSASDGEISIRQKVVITHYDSGLYAVPIPKVNLLYEGTAERLQPTGADSLYVAVNNVPVDLKGDIKNIKEAQFRKSADWKKVFAYFLMVALVAFIAYMLWQTKLKNKKSKALPAYNTCMQALEKIIADPNANSKESLSTIAYSIKHYAQARFKLPVLSATSIAAMRLFKQHPLFAKHSDTITQIFNDADMAKFAQQEFSEDTCKTYAQQAMRMIDEAEGVIREQEKHAAANSKNSSNKK